MIENNLLSSTHSIFKPNDISVNQLISVTHSIFSAFDANPSLEVRGVFLDFLKKLGRVWDIGFLYKCFKKNGTNSNLLDLVESFLHNRRQRVALNGQSSN